MTTEPKLNEVRYEVWCETHGFIGEYSNLEYARQKAYYLELSPSYKPVIYECAIRRE